jgi:hypothetical protein
MLGGEFAKVSVSHGTEQAELGRVHDENLRLDSEAGRYFRDQRSEIFIHARCQSTDRARPVKRTFFHATELAVAAAASISD